MEVSHTGGCACGAIRFEFDKDPVATSNCHCRDCQRATGGPYFPAVTCMSEDFRILQGVPSWYEKSSDAGEQVGRAFCPDCGSPLLFFNPHKEQYYAIYASALDDPSWYRADLDIYVSSAQPWDHLNPEIPHTRADHRIKQIVI